MSEPFLRHRDPSPTMRPGRIARSLEAIQNYARGKASPLKRSWWMTARPITRVEIASGQPGIRVLRNNCNRGKGFQFGTELLESAR